MFLAVVSCVLIQSVISAPGYIRPGQPWYDTEGNRIYAGGGGFWQDAGTYYWVGEGNKVYADLSKEFNLYSSPDLVTWTNVGPAFKNTSIKAPVQGPYRMERPKVFQCPGTGQYVLWFHCDTESFAIHSVGVAVSSSGTIQGPYVMGVPCFEPDGQGSYDMGIFVDKDAAYLVRSVNNQFAGISQLNHDCTNTTGIISSGPRVEGQAIFTSGNSYYLWGSHLTGWAPNPALLSVATTESLQGAVWSQLGNPSNSPTTFDSQSTFVLPYQHASGKVTLVYMGDRWNADGPGGLQNATYIWLPLQGSGSSWNLTWYDQWSLADF
jgi:hypothetical protein